MSAPILLGLRLLAAILLYAFVGWSFYLMWRTLQAQVDSIMAKGNTPIKLGLATSNGEETILDFKQAEFFIGREAECELQIDDSTVSARHARLSFHHGHWWADDAGSKNGTLLNDNLLTMPTIVTNGDTIACGNTTFNVILPE